MTTCSCACMSESSTLWASVRVLDIACVDKYTSTGENKYADVYYDSTWLALEKQKSVFLNVRSRKTWTGSACVWIEPSSDWGSAKDLFFFTVCKALNWSRLWDVTYWTWEKDRERVVWIWTKCLRNPFLISQWVKQIAVIPVTARSGDRPWLNVPPANAELQQPPNRQHQNIKEETLCTPGHHVQNRPRQQ